MTIQTQINTQLHQNQAALDQEAEEQTRRTQAAAESTSQAAQRSQEQQLANKLKIHEHATTHQIADLIQDRDETIDNVATYMKDVADVIRDIKVETRAQGQKLDVIHENMEDAAENVEQANKQLHEKLKKTRTGNKCLIWCIVFAVLAIIAVIVFGFVLPNKDEEITIVAENEE